MPISPSHLHKRGRFITFPRPAVLGLPSPYPRLRLSPQWISDIVNAGFPAGLMLSGKTDQEWREVASGMWLYRPWPSRIALNCTMGRL
jgi:hypothetical protein